MKLRQPSHRPTQNGATIRLTAGAECESKQSAKDAVIPRVILLQCKLLQSALPKMIPMIELPHNQHKLLQSAKSRVIPKTGLHRLQSARLGMISNLCLLHMIPTASLPKINVNGQIMRDTQCVFATRSTQTVTISQSANDTHKLLAAQDQRKQL